MKKTKTLLIVLAAVLLAGGAAAAGIWWQQQAGKPSAPPPGPEYRYVSLDKVLVMLKSPAGASHYLAVDLVFKVLPGDEKRAKEHLPYLRTLAVKALSTQTVESSSELGVAGLSAQLDKAIAAAYQADGHKAPMAEVLVGKLIIE